jgi:hypothetical protein
MKQTLIAALVAVFALSACNQQQPQVVYTQPQAQVVQQPVYVQPQQPVIVQDNSGSNLAAGILLGHALSGGGYNHGYHDNSVSNNTTIVNKTVVVHNHAAPVTTPSVSAPVPVVSAPTPRVTTMNIPAAAPVQAPMRVSSGSSFTSSKSFNSGGFSRRK